MDFTYIVAALITGASGLAGVLITLSTRRNVKRQAKSLDRTNAVLGAVRDQVINGHGTINLREESDERHDQNSGKLDLILADFAELRVTVLRNGERLQTVASRLGKVMDRMEAQGDSIHELEMTQPRPPRPRPRKRAQ